MLSSGRRLFASDVQGQRRRAPEAPVRLIMGKINPINSTIGGDDEAK